MRRPAAVAAFCLLVGATLAAPAIAVAADVAPPTNAVVTISTNCTYFCFVPAQTTIAAGGTVTWVDKSSTPHNITRCHPADCGGSDGGTGTDPAFTAARLAIPAGGTAAFTFAQPGTYVYYCAIHGYGLMHGTITVTAAPAATTVPVTAAPAVTAPATTAAGPPVLAHTGGSPSRTVVLAIALLLLGLAATSLRSRRRAPS
jgi:LPXTG-motif cell wall-anchored protein